MATNEGKKENLFQTMTEEDIREANRTSHLGPALGSSKEIGKQTMDMLLEMQKGFLARQALLKEGE